MNLKSLDVANLEAVIFDLDGTLYPYIEGVGDIYDCAHMAAVQEVLPALEEAELFALARKCASRHHPIEPFAHLSTRSGLSEQEFKTAISRRYHELIYEQIAEAHSGHFKPVPEKTAALEVLSQHIPCIVLTHSCSQKWANPLLGMMGTKHCFAHVLGLEETDFGDKGTSVDPLRTALKLVGVKDPRKALFVEDNLGNLDMALNGLPGIQTTLISPNPKPRINGTPVHVVANCITNFLCVLADEVQRTHAPRNRPSVLLPEFKVA